MIYYGKYRILRNEITAADYDYILQEIERAIAQKKQLLISPIASHTLVRAWRNERLRLTLKKFDYLLPDSQWIRFSLFFLYGIFLRNRIYGPDLMRKVCEIASRNRYGIFLYGNTSTTLDLLSKTVKRKWSKLIVSGNFPSKFAPLTKNEIKQLAHHIDACNGKILLISLGSPLQEIFSLTIHRYIKKPMIIIPVGAAFDFLSGVKSQAPKWMQNLGLEWFYRLLYEPERLWKRYLVWGPAFVVLVMKQKIFSLLDITDLKPFKRIA